jgi:hypothetical protein
MVCLPVMPLRAGFAIERSVSIPRVRGWDCIYVLYLGGHGIAMHRNVESDI